ncbi:MAG: hypothetical protein ACTHOR_16380 [Devosia sp.]
MSLSELSRRSALLLVLLGGAAGLAGCTFTPVYSDQSAVNRMAVSFGQPTNHLEQIVYQDLARRFTPATTPDAPMVTVSVSNYSRALAQSVTTDPAKGQLMTVTGVLRITVDGQPLTTTTRQATSTYSTDSQVLADNAAADAAAEQAAHSLADTLELTIISALTPKTAAAQ